MARPWGPETQSPPCSSDWATRAAAAGWTPRSAHTTVYLAGHCWTAAAGSRAGPGTPGAADRPDALPLWLSSTSPVSCSWGDVNLPLTAEFKDKTKPKTGSNWLSLAGTLQRANSMPAHRAQGPGGFGRAALGKGDGVRSPGLLPVI